MVESNKVNVKLSHSELNKLKAAAENQTGVSSRMNMRRFDGNNTPHGLLKKNEKNKKRQKNKKTKK